MEINSANIANALHSVATEHVVAVAKDIYDKDMEKYQSDINSKVSEIIGIDANLNSVVYYGTSSNAKSNPSKSVKMSISGNYQITTTANSKIYFFVPSSITSLRATVNGLAIPFTVTTVTIDGSSYKRFESTNTYDADTFNIVIE